MGKSVLFHSSISLGQDSIACSERSSRSDSFPAVMVEAIVDWVTGRELVPVNVKIFFQKIKHLPRAIKTLYLHAWEVVTSRVGTTPTSAGKGQGGPLHVRETTLKIRSTDDLRSYIPQLASSAF